MKKLMITLALVIGLSSAVFSRTTFYDPPQARIAEEKEISPDVVTAFINDFTDAQDVTWEIGIGYYRASFTWNGIVLFAFYNEDAELMARARYISSLDLPQHLQNDLRKNYAGYWIRDLFEVVIAGGTGYYITLKSTDGSIVLESKNYRTWKFYNSLN